LRRVRLFENTGSSPYFSTTAADWSSTQMDNTQEVQWVDIEGDGDLDLATANNSHEDRIYINDGSGGLTPSGFHPGSQTSLGMSWGDWGQRRSPRGRLRSVQHQGPGLGEHRRIDVDRLDGGR